MIWRRNNTGVLWCALFGVLALAGSAAVLQRPAGSSAAAAVSRSQVPAAARSLVAARLGAVEPAYHATVSKHTVTVRNRPNRLSVRFRSSGVAVSQAHGRLDLTFDGFGRGSARPVSSVAPVAHANRVSYDHGNVVEWYENGPSGLEQGFTVASRPAGASGQLRLSLGVHGSLAASGRAVRGGVRFGPLAYRGLVAWDARGRRLPARLAYSAGHVELAVDDQGARYPVTVDPYLQLARLTAQGGTSNQLAGRSVAVAGDTVVVGAPGTNGNRGAVLVFVRGAGGWADATQTAKLTASDAAIGDGLGVSVGISSDGQTIVAGAPSATIGSNPSQGAVYVFTRSGSSWSDETQAAKLRALDGTAGDGLGDSVAISGTTVVAGAPAANANEGTAYVFVKPGGGWADGAQTAKLTASDGVSLDSLGVSVAVDGSTIVAGAPAVPGLSPSAGAAYVFVQPGGGWTDAHQTAKLTASDGVAGDSLGDAVGASGDTVVAGSAGSSAARGAAYVFTKPGGGWANESQAAKLTASDGAANDQLGVSVDVDGDTVVAGADGASGGKGAAYVFTKPGSGWTNGTESSKLTDSGGAAGDVFGMSVAVDGATVVAGSTGRSSNTGSAEVFSTETRPGGPAITSAVPGDAQVTVSWTAPGSDGGGTITGYTVTASGGGRTCTWTSGPLSCTVTGLTNGTPYTFTVSATNGAGTGPASAASSPATPVAGPPAPVVTTVGVNAGTYGIGAQLDIAVTFDQAVGVTGTPYLSVTVGSDVVRASYVTEEGPTVLRFGYTVRAGDIDSDGIQLGSAIVLGGGTIVAHSDGTTAARLTLHHVGSTSVVFVDGVAPTVGSVAVPADGTYRPGDNLDFTVAMSEATTVTGTPRLPLTIGATTAYANYVSGSGTTALVFRHTITVGEADSDGIALASALDANGGTLRDAAGNDAALALAGVPSTAGVRIGGPPVKLVVIRQPPSTMVLGSHATVTVAVEDADGAVVTGSGAHITDSASSGCSLVETITSGAESGTVPFGVAFGSGAGTCRISFTAPGLTTATTNPVTVAKIPTTTTIGLSTDTTGILTPVTAVVTVSPAPPAGTVVSVSTGGFFSAAAQVTLDASGTGSGTLGFLFPSTYTATASYTGDSTHAPSQGTHQITVQKHASATALVWDGKTLTATVTGFTASYQGQSAPVPPTGGSVEFLDEPSGTSLGSAAVDKSGVASITPDRRTLPAGAHTIRAVYDAEGKDPQLASSTAVLGIDIAKADVAVTLAVSKAKLEWGRPLTFTVSGVPDDASGSIWLFYKVRGPGYRTVHFATVAAGSGTVTYDSRAAALPGLVDYSASYRGDQSYNASPASDTVLVTTTKRPAKVSLGFSDKTPEWSSPETITATFTPADVTGTVDFYGGPNAAKLASVKIVDGKATYATAAPDEPGKTMSYGVRLTDWRYDEAGALGSITTTKRATHLFVVDCDASGTQLSCPVRRNDRIDASALGRYWYVVPYTGTEGGSIGTQNSYGRTVTELSLPGQVIHTGSVGVVAGGKTLSPASIAPAAGTTYGKKLCYKAPADQFGSGHRYGCGDDPDAFEHAQYVHHNGCYSVLGCSDADNLYYDDGDTTGSLAAPLGAFDFGPLRSSLPKGTTKVQFVYTPADDRYAPSTLDVTVPAPGRPLARQTVGASAATVSFSDGASFFTAGTTLSVPANTFPAGSTLTAVAPGKANNTFLGPDGRMFDVTVVDRNGNELHGPFQPPLKLTISVFNNTGIPPVPSVVVNGVERPIPKLASEADLGSRPDGYLDQVQCGTFSGTTECFGSLVILTTHLTTFALTRPFAVSTGRRAVLRTRARRLSLRVKQSRPATVTFELVRGPRKHPRLVATVGVRHVKAGSRILRFRLTKKAAAQRGVRLVVVATSPMGETKARTVGLVRRR